MSTPIAAALHSGSGMDRPRSGRAARRWRQAALVAGAAMALATLGAWAWLRLPRGLPVSRADLDIATAQPGLFHDALISRATVQPLQSVLLDANEDGRVSAVLVQDGAAVEAGQLLYVLASSAHDQELMARSSEAAQQLANLATFRAQWMAARAAQRRELTQAEFEIESARREQARNADLGARGFISAAAVEASSDRLAQAERLLTQLREDGREELSTREQSVHAMEQAVADLDRRLAALRAASDGLAVRAPVAGRITGLSLQIGQSVRSGDHVARIDSIGRFKLVTELDEFYLPRVAVGLHGTLDHQGDRQAVSVLRIDPLVKEGRFSVELGFDAKPPPDLQVGQGLDMQLSLGQPAQALLLQDGGFYADSGGAWAFVLDADGRHAQRRELHLGRRAAGQIEVLGGLNSGERVVVSSYRGFLAAKALQLTD